MEILKTEQVLPNGETAGQMPQPMPPVIPDPPILQSE